MQSVDLHLAAHNMLNEHLKYRLSIRAVFCQSTSSDSSWNHHCVLSTVCITICNGHGEYRGLPSLQLKCICWIQSESLCDQQAMASTLPISEPRGRVWCIAPLLLFATVATREAKVTKRVLTSVYLIVVDAAAASICFGLGRKHPL